MDTIGDPLMPADCVLGFIKGMAASSVPVWIDGGWGVDALLCRETRPHSDLDFVIEEQHNAVADRWLRDQGYVDVQRGDTRPWNYVLGRPPGLLFDFHVVVFASDGTAFYGPPENDQTYPSEAFAGRGKVGDYDVRCMSLEFQLANHTGYPLRPTDLQDIQALCSGFDRPLPRQFQEKRSIP